jgi:hypothetical protein
MRAKASRLDGRIPITLEGGAGVNRTPARASPRAHSSSASSPPIEWPTTTGFSGRAFSSASRSAA